MQAFGRPETMKEGCRRFVEADVGMVLFGLGQRRGALDKGECLAKILEAIGALDSRRIVGQCPIGRLAMILLGLVAGERRNAAAARRTALFGEVRGHRNHLLHWTPPPQQCHSADVFITPCR